ncbi:MAG: hypothetical protein M1829_005643 [Trizodia sp. TS-e1964]|nr:MAG: hypothetical protein M1829_005643 [Trizodia sp. TS-e1964]
MPKRPATAPTSPILSTFSPFPTPSRTRPTTPALPTSPTFAPPLVPRTLFDSLPLPALIALDLDFVLWPFWTDVHPTPPLRPSKQPSLIPPNATVLLDKHNESFTPFASTAPLLHVLLPLRSAPPPRRIQLVAISRTTAPDVAREVLRSTCLAPSNKRMSEFFDRLELGGKGVKLGKGMVRADVLVFLHEGVAGEEEGVVVRVGEDGLDAEAFDRGVGEWRRRRRAGGLGR